MAFKIYTKTGDAGKTSLFGGKRLSKDHVRIEAYGTIDELNAFVGLVADFASAEEVAELRRIQDRLFVIGSILATDPEKEMSIPDLSEDDITFLEKGIDRMDEILPALQHFILPGGHESVSHAHVARVVCRRAERRVVHLGTEEPIHELVVPYLNRLSDYLFNLGRKIAFDRKVEEVKWLPKKA